ncbi:methylesterase 10 [Gossypium australe]|uniref:Methylesterase 10 n=1 Tax=Gossypium australe TaxID=47621 RepID=A0A5B6UVD5_9ROSI|nr:methylesterase 10 [Gossypium australe]
MEKKGHYVLVHGACHGAWCWYKVITQLKSMGHKVTAMDLAGAGIHPKQVQEVQSFPDYFEPLMNFMASVQPEEKVILVGHSLGGYSISAAMERFPEKVAVAVFATAFMPGPNLPYLTISQQLNERLSPDKTMDSQFLFRNGLDKPPTSDLTLALTLVRHVGVFNDEESVKAVAVTKEKYGTVPRVYVVCGKDNVIKEDFQRWMIENNPSDEVKSISDSDHMVMFSKPNQLRTCLEEIAEKYT